MQPPKMLKTATITQCKQEDIDPDKPRIEQRYCLYSKTKGEDGEYKLLGRHPTAEDAQKQEAAIHAKKGFAHMKKNYYRLAEVPESVREDLYNPEWSKGVEKALGIEDGEVAQFVFKNVWDAVVRLMDAALIKKHGLDTTELSKDPSFQQSIAGLAYFVTDDAVKSALGYKSDALQKAKGHLEALMAVTGKEADVQETLQGLKKQAAPIVQKVLDSVTAWLKGQEQKAASAGKPGTRTAASDSVVMAVRRVVDNALAKYDDWFDSEAGVHYARDFDSYVDAWVNDVAEVATWSETSGTGDVTGVESAHPRQVADILAKLGPEGTNADAIFYELSEEATDRAIDAAFEAMAGETNEDVGGEDWDEEEDWRETEGGAYYGAGTLRYRGALYKEASEGLGDALKHMVSFVRGPNPLRVAEQILDEHFEYKYTDDNGADWYEEIDPPARRSDGTGVGIHAVVDEESDTIEFLTGTRKYRIAVVSPHGVEYAVPALKQAGTSPSTQDRTATEIMGEKWYKPSDVGSMLRVMEEWGTDRKSGKVFWNEDSKRYLLVPGDMTETDVARGLAPKNEYGEDVADEVTENLADLEYVDLRELKDLAEDWGADYKAIRQVYSVREQRQQYDKAAQTERQAVGWEGEPKGWGRSSKESFWNSVGGSVSACIKEMDGRVDNAGGFCSSLRDELEGDTAWRKGPRRSSKTIIHKGCVYRQVEEK